MKRLVLVLTAALLVTTAATAQQERRLGAYYGANLAAVLSVLAVAC